MCATPNPNTLHLRLLLMVAFVFFAAVSGFAQSKTASSDTYADLQAFKAAKLQALLVTQQTQPSAVVATQLAALGHRTGAQQDETAVLIAERELHQAFYAQRGDVGTVAKIQKEIDTLKGTKNIKN